MELNESEAPLANECRFCCKDTVQVNHSRHAKISFQVENASLLLTISIVSPSTFISQVYDYKKKLEHLDLSLS